MREFTLIHQSNTDTCFISHKIELSLYCAFQEPLETNVRRLKIISIKIKLAPRPVQGMRRTLRQNITCIRHDISLVQNSHKCKYCYLKLLWSCTHLISDHIRVAATYLGSILCRTQKNRGEHDVYFQLELKI